MYCPNCDCEEKEGLYLCRSCGGPLRKTVKKQSKSELQWLVRQKLRSCFRSLPFVTAIVLYTIAVVLRVIVGINSDSMLSICWWLNWGESMGWLLSLLDALPGMTTMVGLWMLVAGASFEDGPGTSGLKALVAAEILALLSLLLTAIHVLVAVIGLELMEFTVMIVIPILVLGVILSVKKIGVLFTVTDTVEKMMPNSRLSGVVGVLTIIVGVGGLISMMWGFSMERLLTCVAELIFGIHFFAYKNTMENLEEISVHYDLGEGSKSYYVPGTNRPARVRQFIPTWKRLEMEQKSADRNDD